MFKKKLVITGLLMVVLGFSSIAMTKIFTSQTSSEEFTEQAVTLEGTVYDAMTYEKLSGVEVKIVETEAKTETTDEGKFYFENLAADSSYTLKVVHEGYKDFEETVSAESTSGDATTTWTVEVALQPESSDE